MSDTVGHEPGLMAQTAKALEPLLDEQSANSQQTSAPGTPQNFTAFDWNDFELRYAEALGDADGNEQELLKQFEMLVKYFKQWAASSSAHDTERAIKRLQTRQRFVNLSEQTMASRQEHMTEVLQAFQSALALLNHS